MPALGQKSQPYKQHQVVIDTGSRTYSFIDMLKARSLLTSALMIGLGWLIWPSMHSGFEDQSERLALDAVPGVAPQALAQRGVTYKVAEPVVYYRKEDVVLFEVELLVPGVSETNLAFMGDAERFNAFVAELNFITRNQGSTHFKQTGMGAWEGGKSLVEGLYILVRHPIDSAKNLGSAAEGLLKYSEKVAQGEADALADARDVVDAVYLNEATAIAAEGGFSYQEAVTEEARTITEKMTNWKLSSRGLAEIALLFAPVAAAKHGSKVAKLGEAAKGASYLQKAGEVSNASRGYKTLISAGTVFSESGRILRSLLRVNKLTQDEARLAFQVIRPLCDPAKLVTLGERAANPRVHKLLCHLHELEASGGSVAKAVGAALPQQVSVAAGYAPQFAKEQILTTYKAAKDMGVFDDVANLQKMRRGLSPTILKGPAAGQLVHVDHIIPLKHAPELGNNFANLRYSTASVNTARGAALDSDALNLSNRLQSTGWKPLGGGLSGKAV
jgi:hypothetical protein